MRRSSPGRKLGIRTGGFASSFSSCLTPPPRRPCVNHHTLGPSGVPAWRSQHRTSPHLPSHGRAQGPHSRLSARSQKTHISSVCFFPVPVVKKSERTSFTTLLRQERPTMRGPAVSSSIGEIGRIILQHRCPRGNIPAELLGDPALKS